MRSVLLVLATGTRREVPLSQLHALLDPADHRLVEEGHVPHDVADGMRLGARGRWGLYAFLVRAGEGDGFAVRPIVPAQRGRARSTSPVRPRT